MRDFGSDASGQTLDLRIKVMVPSPGHNLPDFQTLIAQPDASWYQTWLAMDPATRGSMRTYTVREARPAQAEVDVDFVLHPPVDGGPAGPAASWAADAVIGDELILIGPNAAAGPCLGIEFKPGASKRLLLVGDETAVPAIAAILDTLAADVSGTAILEVPESADFLALKAPAGVEIKSLARDQAAHGELLGAAVRAACLPGSHVAKVELEDVNVDEVILWESPDPESDGLSSALYAWIAGEAGVIKELRRYLVREVGMDRKQVAFMGY
ncbi:siderophore-interacting protein [Renibacterium salmoninarum]|uniref:siderophore-interacting protein n=1 Tax=Renibacterium salmoninarum TaxID=1646 RepID=UPI002D76C504|nr:siderophore-interacting protein [Renibacterium salmoninarum]